MSDSEYEDFGSGDESDEYFEEEEYIETRDQDEIENFEDLKCRIITRKQCQFLLDEESELFMLKMKKGEKSIPIAKSFLLRHSWDHAEALRASNLQKYLLGDELFVVKNYSSECQGNHDFWYILHVIYSLSNG